MGNREAQSCTVGKSQVSKYQAEVTKGAASESCTRHVLVRGKLQASAAQSKRRQTLSRKQELQPNRGQSPRRLNKVHVAPQQDPRPLDGRRPGGWGWPGSSWVRRGPRTLGQAGRAAGTRRAGVVTAAAPRLSTVLCSTHRPGKGLWPGGPARWNPGTRSGGPTCRCPHARKWPPR